MGQIERTALHATGPECATCLGSGCQPTGVGGRDDEVRALRGERTGNRRAVAAGRAGHEDARAVKGRGVLGHYGAVAPPSAGVAGPEPAAGALPSTAGVRATTSLVGSVPAAVATYAATFSASDPVTRFCGIPW